MKKSINIFNYILIMLIILNEGFFYIFNVKITKMFKILYLIIIFSTLIYSAFGYKKIYKKMNFKIVIILLILISLIQPINTDIIYGQPLNIGYKLIIYYFSYLSYFYISYNILLKNDLNNIENVLMVSSIIGVSIYSIQYFVYPHIVLSGIDYRIQTRFNEPRLYVPILLFCWGYFISILRLFLNKGNKICNIIVVILNLFFIFYITKTRMLILGIAISTIISYILVLKKVKLKRKIILIIVLATTFFVGFYNIDKIDQGLIGKMYTITKASDQSLLIRLNEKSFYLNQFKENFLIGRGEVDLITNPLQNGNIFRYYLDDLGFLGLLVKFGIVGVAIFGYLVLKIIRILYICKIKDNNYYECVALMIMFSIIGITIPIFDVKENILYVVIFLSFIDYLKTNNFNYINK